MATREKNEELQQLFEEGKNVYSHSKPQNGNNKQRILPHPTHRVPKEYPVPSQC